MVEDKDEEGGSWSLILNLMYDRRKIRVCGRKFGNVIRILKIKLAFNIKEIWFGFQISHAHSPTKHWGKVLKVTILSLLINSKRDYKYIWITVAEWLA